MLNYLGPNIGSQPLPPQLPPATPGTMPQGVPGIAPNPAPLPPGNIHRAPAPPSHPNAHGAAPAPAHILAHILRHAAGGGGPIAPEHPEYETTTQSNGSILLHVKNPDGSRGPVVKVLPPIKPHSVPTPGGAGPAA